MIVPGLILAAVGAAVACALGLRSPESRNIFFHAYLVAFVFWLSITLGGLFFVMLHHLSRAGWSVTLRRLAEAIAANVWMMALLAVPVVVGMQDLYEWSRPAQSTHLAPRDDGHHAERDEYVGHAVYLNPTAFIARLVVCFAIWGGLASFFRSQSIRQDQDGDVGRSKIMERRSAPGMLLFAATITLAVVDLVMSLNPHWASTMIGVYFYADIVMSGLVVLMLLARWLQSSGRLGGAVTVEHYHDLGKLTFAFVFFWGYIAFSQYMLIWYANMPEETQFYIPRQIGPWVAVSLVLVAFHLLIPFLGLLSRHAKRRLGVLTFWGVWLLAAHLLDLFWLIMPNVYIQQMPEAIGAAPRTPLPEALKHLLASNQSVYELAEQHAGFMHSVMAPLEPASLAMVIGLTVGMGGLYLANTARLLRGAALVPVQDPRLDESLAFENA